MFLPVMYDVNRRLQLMRATKGYVKRSGFGKHCRVISGVSSEQILRAMALKGENADIRELLRSSEVDPALKKALAGVLQATSMIVGSEGHRSQIRLRGHAAGWHYGTAHVFCTPNLADGRASLLLQLHCGPDSGDMVESFVINLDWESEQPQLPSASAMRRILASDPWPHDETFPGRSCWSSRHFGKRIVLADARSWFWRRHGRFYFRRLLWRCGCIVRSSWNPRQFAHMKQICFLFYVCCLILNSWPRNVTSVFWILSRYCSNQHSFHFAGRGSMHPHILIYLIGHDLLARLRGVLHGSVHAEVISELDRWSQAVLQAAMSFRCDSQLGLSQRLGEDEVPLPLSAQQRSVSGQQYADVTLQSTEQDGQYTLPQHEHLTGPLPLTGSYGTLRPLYLRRCGLQFFALAM